MAKGMMDITPEDQNEAWDSSPAGDSAGWDDMNISPMSEEDMLRLQEEQKAKEDARRQALFSLASGLLSKRREAVDGRSAAGIDRRWREDQDAFDGQDDSLMRSMLDYATGKASPNKKKMTRSLATVNIVRSKTEIASGRFCEILMPVDDKSWGMKTTPVPELADSLQDDTPAMQNGAPVTDGAGNHATMSQVAGDLMDRANKKMSAMEAEIDDQLTESHFNAECRKAVLDAAKLGTGIMKGPSVVKDNSKKWVPTKDDQGITVHQLSMVESHKPSSRRVNPWNVYPDRACGDDIKKAAYIWERDTILPRNIRDLIGLPGYEADQLIEVLGERPKRTAPSVSREREAIEIDDAIARGELYEMWEYNGDVDINDMVALGCDCEDSEEEMAKKSVSACVIFINDRPVKVVLNILDTGDLPYDFFQWTSASDSPWGFGIPRLLMWQQRIVTAAWRATMDNAGDSAGSQRVISKDLEPADGKWELTRNKIWINNGEGDSRLAFAQFQLESRQGDLQAIIELALKFADQETQIPSLFQGERVGAPETLGATNIMVDSNNVGLRLRVKRWDDQMTSPHITRYYHYNMMYSKKEEIKGDLQVDARGVRVLLEKDQQAQAVMQLWPLMADPEIASIVDKKKAVKQLFAAHRLDILKSDTDIAKEEQEKKANPVQPPMDPAMAVAKVRTDGLIKVAELRMKVDMSAQEGRKADDQANRDHEEKMKNIDYQIEMMKLSAAQNISLDSIKAMLASTTMKLRTQTALSSRDKGKGVPQVIAPPEEPIGRAPAGQAFER